jgi:Cu2+-containing amine oxidase
LWDISINTCVLRARLDMAVDGEQNSVVECNTYAGAHVSGMN